MIQNIVNIVDSGLCTGCGTCVSLCPIDAIKIQLDNHKGIYLPKIDENNCINCKTCFEVCPGYKVDFIELNQKIFGEKPFDHLTGHYLNCYVGYSKDKNLRYNATSGGLITQLLITALDEKIIDGALVTRMKKNKPLKPEPFIARTKKEILEASKSKYCPVPANIALKEILNSKEGEKFAVVGLPCHMHGIRKAEIINKKLKEKIELHIGIFCGTTKNFNATLYQIKNMGINKEEIDNLNYRGKGWPGYLTIKLKDGREFNKEYTDYYSGNFTAFYPWRCTLCCDHTCELADISFGDAWLTNRKKEDKIGSSIIISRNKKAEDLLNNLLNTKIILNEISDFDLAETRNKYHFKKIGINARFFIAKLMGKKIPVYNQIFLPSKISDYLITLYLYAFMHISSKKNLWFLFKVKKIIGNIHRIIRSPQ